MGKFKNVKEDIHRRAMKTFCLLLIFVIITSLSGCSGIQGKKSQKLTVYYVKDAQYYNNALAMYKNLNSKIDINLVEFDTDQELSTRLTNEMASGNGPDVIFMTPDTQIDTFKSVRAENFADLTKYFEKDKDYTDKKYYKNIVEGVRTNGKQYIVPLSFDLNMFYMKSSISQSLGVDLQEKGIDYGAFIKKVAGYQSILRDRADEIGMTIMDYNRQKSSVMSSLINDVGLSVIDNMGNISLTQDAAASTFNLLKNINDETSEKYDMLTSKASDTSIYRQFDSYFYGYGSAAKVISIMQGVLEKFNDKLSFWGIPASDGNGYSASIVNFGVVNANSKNIEDGYKLIKFMMDYNHKSENVFAASSVNKAVYDDVMNDIKKGHIKVDANTATASWDEAMENTFDNVLNNITTISISNPKINEIIENTMQGYMGGTDDFESSYQNMISQLKLYIQE